MSIKKHPIGTNLSFFSIKKFSVMKNIFLYVASTFTKKEIIKLITSTSEIYYQLFYRISYTLILKLEST